MNKYEYMEMEMRDLKCESEIMKDVTMMMMMMCKTV